MYIKLNTTFIIHKIIYNRRKLYIIISKFAVISIFAFMKNNITNSMHPVILIGAGLKEMYTKLDTELKKTVSLNAGIEDSNMRASLNSERNICKKTLRKLSTGLDVYPVLFYVPSKYINANSLEYKDREGIAYIKNFDSFLELIHFSQQKTEEKVIEDQIFNEQVLSALDNLFDKIQLAKKNNLSEKVLKQKIVKALNDLTSSLLE